MGGKNRAGQAWGWRRTQVSWLWAQLLISGIVCSLLTDRHANACPDKLLHYAYDVLINATLRQDNLVQKRCFSRWPRFGA